MTCGKSPGQEALEEVRALQRMALKYEIPCFTGHPTGYQIKSQPAHQRWLGEARDAQQTIREQDAYALGVEEERMASVWLRVCRKWASKHDLKIPHLPGGY